MPIVVRTVAVEDKAAISKLAIQLGYKASEADVVKRIADLSTNRKACVFVAVTEEKVVGWVHAFYTIRIETAPFVEIGALVVDGNYRGQGIGKKLVEQVRTWSVPQEVTTLKVRCNTKRKQSHAFYRQIGFVELKEQKIFEIALT